MLNRRGHTHFPLVKPYFSTDRETKNEPYSFFITILQLFRLREWKVNLVWHVLLHMHVGKNTVIYRWKTRDYFRYSQSKYFVEWKNNAGILLGSAISWNIRDPKMRLASTYYNNGNY